MRFHIPAIPGKPVDSTSSSCAYTAKIVKFRQMFGDQVSVYEFGREETPAERDPAWDSINEQVAEAIRLTGFDEDDLLLIPFGTMQKRIADELPELTCVEYGIGYAGVFAPFRVFESYAWMHAVAGYEAGRALRNLNVERGRPYDCVIPNSFDVDQFPAGDGDGGYLLYLGRITELKGIEAVIQVAEKAGRQLVLAGPNLGCEIPDDVAYVGEVAPDQRAELLGKAAMLLAPTSYIEPFGGVAVEAMLCGTPVITTDWGAFTETVIPWLNGFRCRTQGEMVWAVEHVEDLPRERIREFAMINYSLEATKPKYEAYFEQLLDLLTGGGWYGSWQGIGPTNRYGLASPR